LHILFLLSDVGNRKGNDRSSFLKLDSDVSNLGNEGVQLLFSYVGDWKFGLDVSDVKTGTVIHDPCVSLQK
jgi:hypothetical protein